MNEDVKTYCGIADAHGLESFMECEGMGSAPMTLTMRASLNRQRHAMVYWVELSDTKADEMKMASSKHKRMRLACTVVAIEESRLC